MKKQPYLKSTKNIKDDLAKGFFWVRETKKLWFKICCPKCKEITRTVMEEPFVFPHWVKCNGYNCGYNFNIESIDKVKLVKTTEIKVFNMYRKKDREQCLKNKKINKSRPSIKSATEK